MYLLAIILFTVYAAAILSLRYLSRGKEQVFPWIRKSVHLVTGLILFFLTHYLDREPYLILLLAGTAFAWITYLIRPFGFIHRTSGNSLGTVFFPAGILLSYLLLYDMPLDYFRAILLVLAVSDSLANGVGSIRMLNFRFRLLHEEKSLAGTSAYAISAFLILWYFLYNGISASLPELLLATLIAINMEIISSRGSDNLSVPVGLSLFFLHAHESGLQPWLWIIMILIMTPAAILFFRQKMLTRAGSILAYFMGLYFMVILGIDWTIPILLFFLTSVFFTRLHDRRKGKTNREGPRNIWQVLANSLVAIIMSVLYWLTGEGLFIYLYISLIAAVTADTWASELGPVFNKKCFSLADGKWTTAGVSGGISLAGTAAALAGALLIAVVSVLLFRETPNLLLITKLALAGLAASLVDSLLGAFVEPHLNRLRALNPETPSESPSPNDVVNLLASLTAPAFFLLLSFI